jgi:hypothetical protein
MYFASLDFIGLLQDRIRPVLPLEPVRRFGDPHDVSGHLGIEMGRNRNARRRGDCGSSLPASDASDTRAARSRTLAVAIPESLGFVNVPTKARLLTNLTIAEVYESEARWRFRGTDFDRHRAAVV